MEQNLSESERRQRLASGLLIEAAAAGSYLTNQDPALTAAIAIAGLGFIANYFTCFCGTKKLINSIRDR